MRVRILIVAAIVTSGGLGACSKPADRSAGPGAGRQIQLAEPPSSDSAVVSSIEARQPLKPSLVRRGSAAPGSRVSQAPSMTIAPIAGGAADFVPAAPRVMSTTSSPAAEVTPAPALSPAPEAPEVGFGGSIGHGLGSFQLPANEPQSLSGGRGPMILIRGGMGAVDDKCDLRGGHRGGIAINRSSPGLGGLPRGGIR